MKVNSFHISIIPIPPKIENILIHLTEKNKLSYVVKEEYCFKDNHKSAREYTDVQNRMSK